MTAIVKSLAVLPLEAREALNAGPTGLSEFRAAFARFKCLAEIEQVAPAAAAPAPEAARIVFWNAERLKYLPPSIALLKNLDADVCLLCELDYGMARSGNLHTTRELAEGLGGGHVFAAEFVELDLGDARERGWHAGEKNVNGLHGAGAVSRHRLDRPHLFRLETSGRWFDGRFGERRVGSRIAVMVETEVGGSPVLLVSVHYESHTDPPDRLEQTRILLDEIDRHAPGRPVLIGGDFNTNTMNRADHERHARIVEALKSDPGRLVRPMAYEPMFAELARRGYDYQRCNVLGAPTTRTRPDGTPAPPHGRIDWFFARGLDCSEPAVIPAVDEKGVAISDHEVLAVTIRPARA